MRVWASPSRGPNPPILDNTDPVRLSTNWPLSQMPSTLWVEGLDISSSAGDVAVTLQTTFGCVGTLNLTVLNVELYGDTDRDGSAADADRLGRAQWTKNRGAIFTVNYDRHGTRTGAGGLPAPDAIEFDDNGNPVNEDWVVDNPTDAMDLAPLLIQPIGPLPTNWTVFLKVPNVDDRRRFHLFKQILAGQTAIWGAATTSAPQGVATGPEVEITRWVQPSSPDYLGLSIVMGLEGLFLAGMDNFNGLITLMLEVRTNTTVLRTDTAQLKVAPWLMVSHAEPSLEVWARTNDLYCGFNNANFLAGLSGSGQLQTASYAEGAGTRWFQDHIEIGYYQRPGGPQTHCVFRLPYDNAPIQPQWPLRKLLGQDFAVFQRGIYSILAATMEEI
jgi:hypothetical protein